MRLTTFILKNLLRRPVRSLLTGIGVALAVGAVVALVGISQGFERAFVDLLQRRNVDLMVVRAGKTERLTSTLDESIGRRLAELPEVETVIPGLMDMVSFPEADLISVGVQGWPPDSVLFDDIEIVAGRRLEPGDKGAVMLGTILARNLEKKVGDTIEIDMEPFRVVGIYQSFNVYENGSAVMLLSELQHLMDREGQVTGFQVVLKDAPDKARIIERVRQKIEALTDAQGRPLKLAALPTRKYVDSTLQIRIARASAWLTSVVALVIGTVGMLNTMIMSVFERTREIGILRAIGWRRWRIMVTILGESLLLCVAGAVVGSLAAVGLTKWLSTLPRAAGYVQGDIAPVVLAQGFVLAVLVGLLGGAYPAYRGASLSPTEAIRHE